MLGSKLVYEVSILLRDSLSIDNSLENQELLNALAERKVYPRWLAENLSDSMRYYFLKYDYLEGINKTELYGMLDQIVSDFRHFRKFVLEYIV